MLVVGRLCISRQLNFFEPLLWPTPDPQAARVSDQNWSSHQGLDGLVMDVVFRLCIACVALGRLLGQN